MEINNRTFYGDHLLLTVPSYTSSVIYNNCIFKGINFSEIHVVSNTFIYCRFEDCIFAESLLSIFVGCTFINCEFNGTFKANLFDCDFDTHVPYMPMTCPAVLDILYIDGTPAKETTVFSHYDKTFSYTKGQWVISDYYDNDRRFVCSGGIHFFMERQEAINYYESELV